MSQFNLNDSYCTVIILLIWNQFSFQILTHMTAEIITELVWDWFHSISSFWGKERGMR